MSDQPRNAFYHNLATIEGRQHAERQSIDAIGSLPDPQHLLLAIGEIGRVILMTGEAQAQALARIADAHGQLSTTMAAQQAPALTAPVAFLFHGVGPGGVFDPHSIVGQLLAEASGTTELQSLGPQKTAKLRKEFQSNLVEQGQSVAESHGLPFLKRDDFAQFLAMVPNLLGLIDKAQSASHGTPG